MSDIPPRPRKEEADSGLKRIDVFEITSGGFGILGEEPVPIRPPQGGTDPADRDGSKTSAR